MEHVTWFRLQTLPISLSFWSSCASAGTFFEEGLDEVRDDILLNVDGQIPDHKMKGTQKKQLHCVHGSLRFQHVSY